MKEKLIAMLLAGIMLYFGVICGILAVQILIVVTYLMSIAFFAVASVGADFAIKNISKTGYTSNLDNIVKSTSLIKMSHLVWSFLYQFSIIGFLIYFGAYNICTLTIINFIVYIIFAKKADELKSTIIEKGLKC